MPEIPRSTSPYPKHAAWRPRDAAARRARSAVIVTTVTGMLLALISATPASAATPNAPVLVGPATGSTSASATPALSVTASDPDGGSLGVTFQGRKLGATTPGNNTADPFSIVVLPDTQNYTYSNRQATIAQQAQWAVETRDTIDTAFVIQLGDLVSNFDDPVQWGHVSNGLKVLDDAHLPNTVLPGNHDFETATGAFPLYEQFFPPTRYSGNAWTPSTASYGGYLGQNLFGPDPIDRRNMDNFALFTAGGRDFLVLNLEWEAPQYALDWADKVLDSYPDRTAIMATHSFVSITGDRRTGAQRPGGTAPAKMWNDFVSQHCSIRLVLSGHEHAGDAGEARRVDDNTCGQPVQQILTDYQDRANGGNGWLRYYTFDPAANTMKATTYSPKLGTYETDTDSSFTVPFELSVPQPAPFQTIATTTIASGGVATANWTGLAPDTVYEWRAVSTDGSETSTSPTWTVRTPLVSNPVDDTFTRTVANAWGNADTGQPWTINATASSYSVDGSRARTTVPVASGRGGRLASFTIADSTLSTEVSVTPAPTGSGVYTSLQSRIVGSSSYRAKLQFGGGGALVLSLVRAAPSETTLATQRLTGVTITPGQPVRLVLDVSGSSPTTIRAKAWPASAAEPAAWTLTATDSTAALQGSGSPGIDIYNSSGASAPANVALDRFTVARPGTVPPPPPPPPANVAPDAVIATPTISERTVTLSGAGSSDTDGTVVNWVWSFGDGTTGTGATTSHTYAADGTYPIVLTVTDDDGGIDTAGRSVTVVGTPPPPPPPTDTLAADDFARTTASGWGSSDTGGAWTVAGAATRYATTGSVGTHLLAIGGGAADSLLSTVRAGSSELRSSVLWSRTASAGALYASFIGRAASSSADYRLKVVVATNGRPDLVLVRRTGGAETTLARVTAPGVTVAANTAYSVALRSTTTAGTTTLSAKIWVRGAAEPGWQVTATDTMAALQVPGYVGVNSYMSSSATAAVTTSFDDLRVTSVTP